MRDLKAAVNNKDVSQFKHRCLVFGSPGFTDKKLFNEQITNYVSSKKLAQKDLIFISGPGYSGVDAFLAECCKEQHYWTQFKPEWDDVEVEGSLIKTRQGKEYNALAGIWCDEKMADVSNEGISFYDGVSSGTRDMIHRMTERGNPVRVILVHTDEKENHDQPQGR